MHHHHHHDRSKPVKTKPLTLDSPKIDAIYGLEPVFDPAAALTQTVLGTFVEIQCPACWEAQSIDVDLSAGPRTYIEDCEVCCHPMELTIAVNSRGEFDGISVARTD